MILEGESVKSISTQAINELLLCDNWSQSSKTHIPELENGGRCPWGNAKEGGDFTDVYHHLWDRSRPTIVEMDRRIKRRPAKLVVGTEIECMVESMFTEEASG